MFLILSPRQDGFIAEATWTPELQNARAFTTKIEALDFVRASIITDQEAKRRPEFLGCRVVEFGEYTLMILRKRGYRATPRDDGFDLDVGKTSLEDARENFPREIFGIKTYLVRNKSRISWANPPVQKKAIPAWAKKRS